MMSREAEAALDKVFELASRIGNLMTAALAARELTPARAEVLLVLRQRGRPMVQRELSDTLRCTPRHVTALIDALETHGSVRRQPHPTDRRATLVALTPAGCEAAARMTRERQGAAEAILGELPRADLATFVAVADHVLAWLSGDPPGSGSGPTPATQTSHSEERQ